MIPFTYLRPSGIDEASAAVSRSRSAAFLGGGTTLVDLMKLDVEAPAALVDITGLDLGRVEPGEGGSLRIGSLVRNSDLARNEEVLRRYPVLAEAILSGASPQIRNMATTGGNLLQRTRCSYFRDVFSACNKREPGTGCAAIGGYNRAHALLGTSEKCIATFPGDMPVALVALDASVRTRRAGGDSRSISLSDFYLSYGDDPARETVLEHGELVTHVELPATPWFRRSRWEKVRDRASYEFALASAAVALELSNGRIREARVALGGIATRPWRSREAEAVLAAGRPDEKTFREAAEAALATARPQRHNGFKVELARRTVERALSVAAAMRIPEANS
jgi:xanthine dehydrogenase YagS FAD-binding subunit